MLVLAVAILGLVVPGYALCRALGARGAWAAAFPLSALLLTEIVIAVAILGIPIRFGYVLTVLALVTLLCATFAWYRRQPPERISTTVDGANRLLVAIVATQVLLVLSGLVVRTTLYPLSGADTRFRWHALAHLMLDEESLAHYPPVTAENFTHYTYPDGIAPLVSTIYWWLYAARGSAEQGITSLAIALQFASCLALVFLAGRELFGPNGGLVSLSVLLCGRLLIGGTAIGQETGYTALSVAGQLAFALAAARDPRASNVVVAGLFGGLGALSREYGLLLSLCGLATLVCQPNTRRYVPLYCLVVAACGAAWYLRNWALTGNPVYALDVGLGFPSNPVHRAILASYHEKYSLWNISADAWRGVGRALLLGATVPCLAGLSGFVLAGRRAVALILSAAITLGIWLLAIGYTSGGLESTVRVLNPTWVVLSIAAGAWGRFIDRPIPAWGRIARGLGIVVLILAGAHAAASAWSFPSDVDSLPEAAWMTTPPESGRVALAKRFNTMGLPPFNVLTDDCYLAVALQRHSQFKPVMVWSPQVAFLFDNQLGPAEMRRRLLDERIGFVSFWIDSPNNTFLLRSSFYHTDSRNWLPLIHLQDTESIYALPQDTGPTPPPVSNP